MQKEGHAHKYSNTGDLSIFPGNDETQQQLLLIKYINDAC